MELNMGTLAVAALIAMLGSFVQSTTGFGYAVTVMALWPMILPFKTATVAEAITAAFIAITIAVKCYKFIRWKYLVVPSLTSICLNWVGINILQVSSETFLRRVLGAALMLLAVYFIFFSTRIHVRPTVRNGMIAGGIAGLMSGMFSIGGPPIVAYYINALEDKREYTATTQIFFLINTVSLIVMHFIVGNMTPQVLQVSAWAVVGMAVGTAAGLAVFNRLQMATIKKLVYGFMMVMGLYTLIVG